LQDWAARTFGPSQGDDAVHVVHAINEWICRSIRYRRREDRGVQSPLESLGLASGSCREMATLLLEIVRSLRLAGRFASGYLDSAAPCAGQASTHAWTKVYFPEHGWFGCDPTLGEGTSQKHIVCGVSSHPRGVMPGQRILFRTREQLRRNGCQRRHQPGRLTRIVGLRVRLWRPPRRFETNFR